MKQKIKINGYSKVLYLYLFILSISLFYASPALCDVSITADNKIVNQCDTHKKYTVTVANPAAAGANLTEMSVQVDLKSSDYIYESNSTTITTDANGSKTGSAANPSIAGNVLTWNLDTLFGGNVELLPSKSLTVVFYIKYGCAASSNLPKVTLTGERPRGTPITPETKEEIITVKPGAVTITVSPSTQSITLKEMPSESNVTWTITVKNTGIGNIYNVDVNATFGQGVDYNPESAKIGSTTLDPHYDTNGLILWDTSILTSNPDGAGSGIEDLDGDGKYDDLAAGESFVISNVSAVPVLCEDLTIAADVKYGANSGEICYDSATAGATYAASVAVNILDPIISIVFDPDNKLQNIPYCGGVTDARIVISNFAGAGEARWHHLSTQIPQGFTISNIRPAGISYDSATGLFTNIGNLKGGESITIYFDANWTGVGGAGSQCSISGSSASFLVEPLYKNVCAELFYPPVVIGSVSLGAQDRMSLSVTKTGVSNVKVKDTNISFPINVTLSGFDKNPTFDSGAKTIIDTFPANWSVADAAGGTVSGNTISWTHTFNSANPTFSKVVKLNAPIDPCAAGYVVSNVLSVQDMNVTDCRGCVYTLSGSSSLQIYIDQDTDIGKPIDGFSKSAAYLNTQTGNKGETCRNLQYTAQYDFSTFAGNTWTGIYLHENLLLSQSNLTLISVKYNGNDYTSYAAISGSDINLSGLESSSAQKPDAGGILEVVFTTLAPEGGEGSGIQFSRLYIPSASSGCGSNIAHEVGVPISIGSQSMGIGLSGNSIIESCSINTHTISITKDPDFIAYDPIVTLDLDPDNDGVPNYGYIPNSTTFSGNFIDDNNASFGAFEPTRTGNKLVWNFSAKGSGDFKSAANISVQLRLTCNESVSNTLDDSASVKIEYNKYCKNNTIPRTQSASASYDPAANLILKPDLISFMTPGKVFVVKEPEQWTLNITNKGRGAAYNVSMITTLQSGITLASADINWSSKVGNVYTWNFQEVSKKSGLEDLDNDGFYDDLPPGKTVSVKVDAYFSNCANLAVNLVGYSGCEVQAGALKTAYGSSCTNTNAYNVVAHIAPTQVTVADSFDGDLSMCASRMVTFLVKNTGLGYVYDVQAKQILPNTGIFYVFGDANNTFQVDADANGVYETTLPLPDPSGNGTSGDPYIWNTSKIPALAELKPEASVRINYKAKGDCNTVNSDMKFQAQSSWKSVCDQGSSTGILTASMTLLKMNVDTLIQARNVTAGGTFSTGPVYAGKGDIIEYDINLSSNGGIDAQNTFLDFVIPSGTSYISGSKNTPNLGSGTSGDPLKWIPTQIAANDTGSRSAAFDQNSYFQTTFQVKVNSCVDGNGTSKINWGCDGTPPMIASCQVNPDIPATNSLKVSPNLESPVLTITDNNGTTGSGVTDRGKISLTIKNTGGSARNIILTDTLITGFAIDTSSPPVISNTDTGAGAINAVILGGTAAVPIFTLTSSTGADPQNNLLRYNQTVTLTFYIKQDGYLDVNESQDVSQETIANGLDPTPPPDGNNNLSAAFQNTCGTAMTPITKIDPIAPKTPDLDIDLLTPIARLVSLGKSETFTLRVYNRGDTAAQNGELNVTIGAGWSGSLPSGCTGSVPGNVKCPLADIAASGSYDKAFTLTVANETSPLTFLAKVEGNIVDKNGTDTGNNYSLDTIRSKVLGYTFTKTLQANSEADSNASQVWIGEDYTYRITAKWFGGSASDIITGAIVTDTIPIGHGHVSNTQASGGGYVSGALNISSPAQFSSGTLMFDIPSFDTSGGSKTFQADVIVRTLNSALNSDAAPNTNNAVKTDIVDGAFTFQGTLFNNASTGFPALTGRQQSVTVLTPSIIMTKQVRNVTENGSFAATAAGDAGDIFEYKVYVTNSLGRAQAYDLNVTETVPAKMNLLLFASDGIDNDGDGLIDGADTNGEGVDNGGGLGKSVLFNRTYNTNIGTLDPWETAIFLYRVQADDSVIQNEDINSTAYIGVDTLDGASGSQSAPQGSNGTATGSRRYTANGSALIKIDQLAALTPSKAIKQCSNTILGGASPYAGPQSVVIGEEVRYVLQFKINPSTLTDWNITDTMPSGVIVTEAYPLVLDPAKFSPGGTITPVISNSNRTITWSMGTQILKGTSTDQNVSVEFIGRVENITANQNGTALTNSTAKTIQNGTTTTFNSVTLNVKEPVVTIAQTIVSPVSADAGDRLNIQVVVSNTAGNAPAYNVRIKDDLINPDKNMDYIIGSQGGTNSPDSVDTNTTGIPIFKFNTIPAGGSKTFTYQIEAQGDVTPHEILDNNVTMVYQSLPDTNTSLKSTPLLGYDGAADGMRNGDFSCDGGLNDYEGSNAKSITVPAPNLTKTDLNPTLEIAIGARRHYQVKINLPEGDIEDLKIVDNLAFGAASLVLENDAVYDANYTLTGITEINGISSLGNTAAIESSMAAVPTDESTGTITWNFGKVLTTKENDTGGGGSISPSITIDYYARITNASAVQAGGVLKNNAKADYKNGETNAAISTAFSTTSLTVLEPALIVVKKGRNITKGDSVFAASFSSPDAGDFIEYQLTVTNGSTNASKAYDVNIKDMLPAPLDYNLTVSAKLNGSDIAGFNPTPSGTPDGPLVWGRDNGDNSLDIPAGQSFVLTYRVQTNNYIKPQHNLDNPSVVDWTSLDGSNADERNGSGGVNDYITTAALSLTGLNTYSIEKVRTSDTYNAGDIKARVGDIVTYEIRFTMQEGTANNVKITDALPTGFAFLRTVSVTGDTAAPYTGTAPFTYTVSLVPDVNATGNVNWNFGTIVNDGDNNGVNNVITIVYEACIKDTLNITALPALQQPNNIAKADYSLASGSAATQLTESEAIDLIQPSLSVTKTLVSGQSAIVQGNDTVNYRITVHNLGDGPAYNIRVRDVLPAVMRKTTPTTMGASIDGSPVVLTSPSFNSQTGELFWSLADAQILEKNKNLIIDFRAKLDASIQDGMTINNVTKIDAYYSKPSSDTAHRRKYKIPPEANINVYTLGITLQPEHEKTVESGNSLTYAHELKISKGDVAGTLSFNLTSSKGMNWAVYKDVNDNGKLDSTDTIWTNGSSINTGTMRIFLMGTVPASAYDGWVDNTKITVVLSASGKTFQKSIADITKVVTDHAGALSSSKEAAIDSDCDGTLTDESLSNKTFEVRKHIKPGECAIYKISFTNVGTGILKEIEIHDKTPAYSLYLGNSAKFNVTPAGMTANDVNITQPSNGGKSEIIWKYGGTLIPGSEGSVTYEVRVQQ